MADINKDFECLILVQKKEGEIIAVREKGWRWGTKEVPPLFEIVEINCTDDEAKHIEEKCKYDKKDKLFKDKEDDKAYAKSDIVEKITYTDGDTRSQEYADTLAGTPIENPCSYLSCSHLDGTEDEGDAWYRLYWTKLMYKLRREPGIMDLLKTIKYGFYPDIFLAIQNLPLETKQKIADNVTDEDLVWLKRVNAFPQNISKNKIK